MRQRRVTGIEERLAEYSDLILKTGIRTEVTQRFDGTLPAAPEGDSAYVPTDRYPRWYQRRSEQFEIPAGYDRIYAEFGCGRGQFINSIAEKDPDGLYIGIEGCKTIVYKAIKKTKIAELKNVFYIDQFINYASMAFEKESFAGIFLNFSDPWPKERHSERRLTAPAKALNYKRILKPDGFLALKTDNEALFNYSLKVFEVAGYYIESSSRNLEAVSANTGIDVAANGKTTQTEYEQKFRAIGLPIYYFLARKR